MNNLLIDSRDLRYVLFEVLDLDNIVKYKKFENFDHATFDATLDLIETVAVKECFPYFEEADKEGCSYDSIKKNVICPEAIKKPLKAYYNAEFIGISDDEDIGGMGMPSSIGAAHMEFISASHQSLLMYAGLSHGSMSLIHKFGTDEQKEIYIKKMMSGEWGGTMCLTESQAGSDVGRITAKAVKQSDGTYQITGQKIFISAGENDIYDNIVHPVLARIEGDPAGVKGISIFLVPKFIPKSDGTLGEFNNVICIGIEKKMGIKGCVTCSLSFGEENVSKGFLLGEERKGMKIMFNMMNDFRMATATQAQGVSSAAMMHSISYAKTRLQGNSIKDTGKEDAPMVSLLAHADVKRSILWMKSYVDSQRLLLYYMYSAMDIAKIDNTEKGKEAKGLVDFLVPICKAGFSDQNTLITSEAMQIFGGYGFCNDYPIEQMFRNSKILSIFEGANGIQGIDLVMRKIVMDPEQKIFNVFKEQIFETINLSKGVVDEKYISIVQNALEKVNEVVEYFKENVEKFKFDKILESATPFRHAVYLLALGWMHLKNLIVALPALKRVAGTVNPSKEITEEISDASFYYARVLASRFFFSSEIQKVFSIADSILVNDDILNNIESHLFTGVADL